MTLLHLLNLAVPNVVQTLTVPATDPKLTMNEEAKGGGHLALFAARAPP